MRHRHTLFIIQLIFLLAVATGTCAQTVAQQFAAADWFSRPLGNGVVWRYYLFDNLFGARQSIQYIEADLTIPGVKVELPYRTTSLQRTSTMIKNQFPAAAAGVNGTFFTSTGHRTLLKVNGTIIPPSTPWTSDWGYTGGLAFNRSTNLHRVLRRPQAGWTTIESQYTDYMVNGPLVLYNGAVPSATLNAVGSHCTARHPRTAVGLKSGSKLILMVADGRHANAAGLTCVEIGQVMQALGCIEATSLDGGGSSTMYGRGEPDNGVINYPSDNGVYNHLGERSVINAIAIMGNPATQPEFDARLESISYPSSIQTGERKNVVLRYRNIGTQTWTADRVTLTTSRALGRISKFYDPSTWISSGVPARIATLQPVPPNGTVTFTIPLLAPSTPNIQTIEESFQLTRDETTRFGPADNETMFKITLSPGSAVEEWDIY